MTRATTAVYVYGVVRATKRPSVARSPAGVPDASQAAVHAFAPALWIVTAIVPLDVYGPSRLEPRLRDLDWVAAVALSHEAVVEHFARPSSTTVIPMKLFTMFSTVDKAIRDVVSRADEIRQAMRRISGAEEWGIRVFQSVARGAAPVVAPTSGAEFLRARKRARDAAGAARSTAHDAAETAFEQLRLMARDARLRDGRREPGTNPPVLDAAFLIPSAARARFRAEVRRQTHHLARVGAELVLTGPWPAYNFVTGGGSA